MPVTTSHRYRRAFAGLNSRRLATLLLAGSLALGVVVATNATSSAVTSPSYYGIWKSSVQPRVDADPDDNSTTLGVQFSSSDDGWITAIQFYRSAENTGVHTGQLWTAQGRLLGTAQFTESGPDGWQTGELSQPVAISAGVTYVASYVAPEGHYADDQDSLNPSSPVVYRALTAWQGVYTYGSGMPDETWNDSNYYVDVVFSSSSPAGPAPTTPVSSTAASQTTRPSTVATTPTSSSTSSATTHTTTAATSSRTTSAAPTSTAPTTVSTSTSPPPVNTDFPNASNTGVPDGTVLTAYTGPMTITDANTVIDAKTISGTLLVRAPGVKITRSKIVGNIDSDDNGSVSIIDTEVDGQQSSVAAIIQNNVTMLRVNVHGARQSVTCGSNCDIEDSWLHGQYNKPGESWHVNGYISNGGSNVLLKHNTLACDTPVNQTDGGCTAPAAIFGDFSPLSDITFDGNLFVAGPSAYCLYAGWNPTKPYGSNPTRIIVKNNVFQRGTAPSDHGTYICAYYGPVTSFLDGLGNVWANNRWDDGTILTP